MIETGLNKLFWGFLFISINFRICGIDIFPDVIGYILFALAFNQLKENSEHFSKASTFNIFMIVISIFSIYEAPNANGGINLGFLGILSIPMVISSFILTLLVVYNLFMGVKELMSTYNKYTLAIEAEERWKQYIALIIATAVAFAIIFIPVLNIIYLLGLFVFSIVFLVKTMKFISNCKESFR
ncbi:MAG TPA: hypothetical protein DCM59_10720 [Clostridium sp.]|nr:hypothetical protein [Clostridium sp.]